MRWLRFGHRWLGLLLALPLLLQGLTGAVLALEPVIAGMGHAGPPPAVASADALVAAARAVAPPGMRAVRYQPPGGAGEPARVVLLAAGQSRGPGRVISVDPVTAVALGPAVSDTGFFAWLKRFHENWLVPAWGGRQFAGWLGVGLVALILLGIPIWWPRPGGWRAAFTVSRRARGARLQRALHGAMGGWCALLLLVTGVTGITQGFPQTTRAAFGVESGRRPAGSGPDRAVPTDPPDLDAAIALAKAAAPELELRMAMLPTGPEPLRLILAPPGATGASAITIASVDPRRSPTITLQKPEQLSAAERWLRVLRDIHAAEGFGPVWLSLTVLAGFALPGFAVTGVLLWLIKRGNRRRASKQVPAERLVHSS